LRKGSNDAGGDVAYGMATFVNVMVFTPQREETRAFSHNYSKDQTEQS